MNKAKYKCMECNHEWEGDPGPVECQLCGHLYVKWVNYEESFVRNVQKHK